MLTKYYYVHHESGVIWESLLPPEIELVDLVEPLDLADFDKLKDSGHFDVRYLSNVEQIFYRFIKDSESWDMFITGKAGTGKTYSLKELIQICELNHIRYQVCSHTHKACAVLRGYLPTAPICTLHSFLKKRPAINDAAEHVSHVSYNAQMGTPDQPTLLFIDELGVVGEKDLMDVRAIQDPAYEGAPYTKVVWLGDSKYQTLPVGDIRAVIPEKPYWIELLENKRSSTLQEPLDQLTSFIDGAKPEPLKTSEYFVRGIEDLAGAYLACNEPDKVILAYTNEQVQNLNFTIQGYDEPKPGDKMFSPTLHQEFTFVREVPSWQVQQVDQYGDSPLTLNSKYKTLEFMIEQDMCKFYDVTDEEGEEYTYAVIFGTYNYKRVKDEFKALAAQSNVSITKEFRVQNAATWAKSNPQHVLARKRALAWRKFLTIDSSIFCMDFNHAMTVHKSQGSSYQVVFLDTNNLGICADRDYINYLRLFYTGMSRSRKFVITN